METVYKKLIENKDYGSIIYTGEVKDGKPHGKGIAFESWKMENEKLLYSGDWKDGVQHGIGTSYDVEGKVMYVGGFKDNLFDGEGTIYYRDGTRFVGQWKKGTPYAGNHYPATNVV